MRIFVLLPLLGALFAATSALRVPPPPQLTSADSSLAEALHWQPPVYNSTVWEAFRNKTLLNPVPPLVSDPYNVSDFNTTWPDTVCAVLYPEPSDRSRYLLVNYTTAEDAVAAGAYVTHLHPCGACSTTQDLSVYMQFLDLTNPVRSCALESFISLPLAVQCLAKIGFTEPCAAIWMYDAMNTRRECLDVCLAAWINHTPNNVPPNSTNLNDCIRCDEDKSGPIFKRVAGRTRRDSGLRSAINRPNNTVYHLTHYYY